MKRLVALGLACLSALGSAQSVLVVGNKPVNTATIVDVTTGVTLATLPTGLGPHEAATSRDGKWAVVSDCGTGPDAVAIAER